MNNWSYPSLRLSVALAMAMITPALDRGALACTIVTEDVLEVLPDAGGRVPTQFEVRLWHHQNRLPGQGVRLFRGIEEVPLRATSAPQPRVSPGDPFLPLDRYWSYSVLRPEAPLAPGVYVLRHESEIPTIPPAKLIPLSVSRDADVRMPPAIREVSGELRRGFCLMGHEADCRPIVTSCKYLRISFRTVAPLVGEHVVAVRIEGLGPEPEKVTGRTEFNGLRAKRSADGSYEVRLPWWALRPAFSLASTLHLEVAATAAMERQGEKATAALALAPSDRAREPVKKMVLPDFLLPTPRPGAGPGGGEG